MRPGSGEDKVMGGHGKNYIMYMYMHMCIYIYIYLISRL